MDDGLLTARQKEVVALLAQGRAYKEIAVELDLSVETVRQHIKDIYRKLQVHSKTQAAIKVLKEKA